ncbi:MAG: type I 3-dehydroquinate dehydratase [Thermodesulfobacteriota bacterium]
MICVSIAEPTVPAALAAARAVQDRADLLEIRLDALDQPAVAPFVSGLARPLLFTNRPNWEGGASPLPDAQRLAPLHEAIALGAAYVDVELGCGEPVRQRLVQAAAGSATRVIVSWHDFASTPGQEALAAILRRQQATGASLGKVVTMACHHLDVLRVLGLQTEAAALGFPLIAFAMGPLGAISRLACLRLGSAMTYAAPTPERATAPGQLTVDALLALLAHFPS